MAVEKFYATVNAEGATGPVRGKIPTGLVRALKADSGDMIEFEVQGRHIIGGRVLTDREQNKIINDRAGEAPAKRSTTKPKAKAKAPASVPKKSVAKAPVKAAAKTKTRTPVKAASVPKRKTKVTYEEPTEIRKPKKKISFSKKR